MTTSTTQSEIHDQSLPLASAVSDLLTSSGAKLSIDALPLEILHNLQYQHDWSDVRIWSPAPSNTGTLRPLTPTSSFTSAPLQRLPLAAHVQISHRPPIRLIAGSPPRPIYIHPDFQAHLLKHDIQPSSVPSLVQQTEFVLPLNIAEKYTLSRLAAVFDALPHRSVLEGADGYKHQDAKRVLLGMISTNGMSGGGDGTVVYYILQEGDVKPRQN